jgi:ABC-type polysaccharide/polyol phosphate export permease
MSAVMNNSSGLVPLMTNPGDDLIQGLLKWDLWGRLGWLEVKRRYRRTVVGPFWSTLSLAIFIGALGSIGSGLWSNQGGDYLPFLAGGMVVWIMLSTIITESCTLFVSGGNLFRQMRFDYSILAYALVWRNFITFLHNSLVYVLVTLLFAPHLFTPMLLLAIPGIILVLINGAWIALLFGLFCLRFRDMQQLVASLVQISMFVTPIFWSPESLAPNKRFVFVILNPLYHLIDVVRAPLLGRAPTAVTYMAVIAIAVFGWTITYLIFRRFRKRVAYWS